MSTLATMRSRIADDLNRTDLNTQIDLAINRAIHHYEDMRTWFNETTDTFATVASQQSYGTSDGLASDVLEIDRVTFTSSSNYVYTLVPRTIQYILDVNTSGSTYTGDSSDWAWFQEKIYLYPTPDAAYTITVYYHQSYSDLSADGDSNDWTNNAEDLIESRAQWWINKRLLKNPGEAASHKEAELDALRRLQDRTNRLIATGKIRKTHF